jgi:hypothetical protein
MGTAISIALRAFRTQIGEAVIDEFLEYKHIALTSGILSNTIAA